MHANDLDRYQVYRHRAPFEQCGSHHLIVLESVRGPVAGRAVSQAGNRFLRACHDLLSRRTRKRGERTASGINLPFAVLSEPSHFSSHPKERSTTSVWAALQSMRFISFDDLNGGFQALLYAISEGLAGVAAIDQHAFNSL